MEVYSIGFIKGFEDTNEIEIIVDTLDNTVSLHSGTEDYICLSVQRIENLITILKSAKLILTNGAEA